jgi:hypothetical protein
MSVESTASGYGTERPSILERRMKQASLVHGWRGYGDGSVDGAGFVAGGALRAGGCSLAPRRGALLVARA